MDEEPQVAVRSCPAKINFGLRVKHRRPDGYHEIESIFLPIDFADSLEIRLLNPHGSPGESKPGADSAITSRLTTENLIPTSTATDFETVSERGNPNNNLVMRILDCINRDREVAIHLQLHLKKRIPSGAGLGGGSSDAGALLRWMLDTDLADREHAFTCARSGGADIPFFLNPTPSVVTGIGEKIQPVVDPALLDEVRKIRGILALSSYVIPTKNAYMELKRPLQSASKEKSGSGSERALRALIDADESALAEVRNDFEEFAFRLHPELERVKKAFSKNEAFYSSMTGSGSAIYGLFRFGLEARALSVMEEEFAGFRFVPFRIQF